MRIRKVLFLDFDGVLHPLSSLIGFEMRMKREDAISLGRLFRWAWILEELLVDSNVEIFVHSSWRQFLKEPELLQHLGPVAHRFRGCTELGVGRWEGIQRLVQELNLLPDEWIVLDDRQSEFPENRPPQLILCDSNLGVWDEHVREKIISWLTSSATFNT